MISRSFDAKRINEVLNHPAVYPWVAMPGMGAFDFTDVVADKRNVLLMNEHGGFLFIPKGDGKYEVHTQFLPAGRSTSLKAAREAAAFMFTQTDCETITTYVPQGNRGAKRLVTMMNFKHAGCNGEWTYPDGHTVPIDWYELTKRNWLCQQPQ